MLRSEFTSSCCKLLSGQQNALNIGSYTDLVPLGNKVLPHLMFTQIYVATRLPSATMCLETWDQPEHIMWE